MFTYRKLWFFPTRAAKTRPNFPAPQKTSNSISFGESRWPWTNKRKLEFPALRDALPAIVFFARGLRLSPRKSIIDRVVTAQK